MDRSVYQPANRHPRGAAGGALRCHLASSGSTACPPYSLPAMQNPDIDLGTYGIWTGTLDLVASARAREHAAEIEQLGFGALWIPETVFRDVFIEATFLLEATSAMKIATGIANRYARDALTTNAVMQTLNEAYPGRFLLGLGASHENLVAGIRKHSYDKPYSAMVEYLDEMDEALFMAPRGEPPARMVLAALGPRMLRLAAERTAGALPYFVPPEHTVVARDVMGEEPLLAVEQMVVLDEDPESARATARAHMSIYLGLPNYANNLKRLGFTEEEITRDGGADRVVDAIVAWGDEETVLRRVQEHLDAGADHVCIQVLGSDASSVPAGDWRRIAEALWL